MEHFVCIGLCVYNNAKGLPRVLRNIEKLKKVFQQVKIIAFYDTSSDNSLDILKNHGEIDILVSPQHYTKSKIRTENIAFARNQILARIRDTYYTYPYFIMMDSNEYSCVGELRIEPILWCLQHVDLWDGISFNREAGYYDTWALSFEPFVYSFFHFTNWKKVVEKMRAEFQFLLENAEKKKELIPVLSAFNGFAIYKTNKFLNCRYSSDIRIQLFPKNMVQQQIIITGEKIVPNFSQDCEHRAFHLEAIQQGAKLRICPDFVFCKLNPPEVGLRGPA